MNNRIVNPGLIVLGLCISSAYAEDLLVFMPGEGSTAAIESEIQKNASGSDVKAFNNVKDFEKARDANPSASIIAPAPLIEMTGGYDFVFKGFKGGDVGEKYLLVTANDNVQIANIADKKVGVWDVFGKKNVEPFLQKSFGVAIKKVKRVNKKEDLLTLLGIDMVDAILISNSDFERLKKTTDLKLRVLSQSASNVGFISVAVPKGGNAGALKGLVNTSKNALKEYSFDGWRAK